jgi:mannan endo-1,4-beta-mannosidase
MPWYGDYTMDGWAHDNTVADWKSIMNNPYVITLDNMPGWDRYVVPVIEGRQRAGRKPAIISLGRGFVEITHSKTKAAAIEIFTLKGIRVATLSRGALTDGTYRFNLKAIAAGVYLVRISAASASMVAAKPIMVR